MSAIGEAVALLAIGILAGIVSTVASLASVVSYPALLALGLSPVSANVTNTVALMFTGIGAAAGSRPELAGQADRVRTLGLLTAAGGGAGAAILLLTPSRGFEYAAPLLIALGSVLLLRRGKPGGSVDVQTSAAPNEEAASTCRGVATAASHVVWLSRAAVFGVAVYIGYFGAAGGIIMLAALVRVYAQPLAKTNALKNVISGLANAVAGIGFAIFGPVRWTAAIPLAAGFLIGGWIGPSLVRRLPADGLRVFIGVCGVAVAIRLGVSTY